MSFPRWRLHRWGFHQFGLAAAKNYSTMLANSSAVVTALVAPGALASLLARPSEHAVLSQLLRAIRAVVLLAAGTLFGLALMVALNVPRVTFGNWLFVSLVVALGGMVSLLVGYRNCERLPARPGWYSRKVILWREWRRPEYERWLASHSALGVGEQEGWLSRRRRRVAVAALWGESFGAEGQGDSIEECLVKGSAIVRQLESPLELTTREPRELPFQDPSAARFLVRLNRVECLELEPLASRLVGLETSRRKLLDSARL